MSVDMLKEFDALIDETAKSVGTKERFRVKAAILTLSNAMDKEGAKVISAAKSALAYGLSGAVTLRQLELFCRRSAL